MQGRCHGSVHDILQCSNPLMQMTIMDQTSKTTKTACKAIDCIGYFLLTAFMTIFGISAVCAILLAFIEKDWMNLFGAAGCAAIAWTIYLVRRTLV